MALIDSFDDLTKLIQILKAMDVPFIKVGDIEIHLGNKSVFQDEPKKEKEPRRQDQIAPWEDPDFFSHLPNHTKMNDEPAKL